MVQNVRLQRLRDFTVQIRDPDSDRSIGTGIVGTGIVIEPDRIITCAHVVEAALGRSPRDAANEMVEIHFPRVEGREPLSLHAVVDLCFREHDDDLIALKLVDGTAPFGAGSASQVRLCRTHPRAIPFDRMDSVPPEIVREQGRWEP